MSSDEIALGFYPVDLEILQVWRMGTLSGQSVPLFHCPSSEENLCLISSLDFSFFPIFLPCTTVKSWLHLLSTQ